MKQKIPSGLWLLLPAVAMLLAFFLLPSLDILAKSVFDPNFTSEHFLKAIGRSVYRKVLLNTFQVALIVSTACVVIGYPVAYFIATQPRKRQFTYLFLIFVPLWMSILVRTYAWMVVLGREGILNTWLITLGITDEPVKMLYTTGTVYLAMIQILLPIQIITCFTAMSDINLDLIRAARVLGASKWQAIRRVFIPLSIEGTVSGFILVFMLTMGFFITPALVGGREDLMLGNLIEMNVGRLKWGFAAALAVVLLTVTMTCVVIFRKLSKHATRLLVGATSREV
tara:strand:- start:332 stop:1180 length:849 start_codon:yes stop_codon:yes gene_type:complete